MTGNPVNYTSELKKFITSQYIYSGVRVALAIVIPSIILAYMGLLKEYFLFPLATSFVGLTDMPGPMIRRRNALLAAAILFPLIAAVASVLKDYPPLIFVEITVFGLFFTMFGVYGQRFASIGSLALVVMSIFIDGHLTASHTVKNLMIFAAGCFWFFAIFMVVTKIQPYKLAGQMIGENYILLSDYLKIKARFYLENPDYDQLYSEVISKQITIKNLQEETREVVFKTRQIVNESTTTSRLLMVMFLNCIDLYEKLITNVQDYRTIHQHFLDTPILTKLHDYLLELAEELSQIGIALQSGSRNVQINKHQTSMDSIYELYFKIRSERLQADNLEHFMILRLLMTRVGETAAEIRTARLVFTQDLKNATSLSLGLDYEKFLPGNEKLNSKLLVNNLSLRSAHFRHALRVTISLLLGYLASKLHFLGIGHTYWILITILAIMRPAFSTTKHRNLLRLYGTAAGAVAAYVLLTFVHESMIQLAILLASMILCFSLLKDKYAYAVFFMTLYIFITFNFLNPGNVDAIFKDRLLDTAIGGAIVFLISYFVFPVWEHTQNVDFMKESLRANIRYFTEIMRELKGENRDEQRYRIARKGAIIKLANLSDNFQRMLSDPKNQRAKLTVVHQFVNTSHLITAYLASLAQHTQSERTFSEIDWQAWSVKIMDEIQTTLALLEGQKMPDDVLIQKIKPADSVDEMMQGRKSEIIMDGEKNLSRNRQISHLAQLKNLHDLLELLHDVAQEQRKAIQDYVRLKGTVTTART